MSRAPRLPGTRLALTTAVVLSLLALDGGPVGLAAASPQQTPVTGWWPEWKTIGGQAAFNGALDATSSGHGRIELVVQGTDDSIYFKAWTGSAWTGWTNLGAPCTPYECGANGALTIVSWGAGRLDVFTNAKDDRLHWRTFSAGQWSPSWVYAHVNDATPVSEADAASPAVGRIDLFYSARSDSRVYAKTYVLGSGWVQTLDMGTTSLLGSLTVTDRGAGRLEAFVSDWGDSYQNSWTPTGPAYGWTDWTLRDSPPDGVLRSELDSASGAATEAHLLSTEWEDGDPTTEVVLRSWSSAYGWGPWQRIGDGIHSYSSPTVVSWGAGRVDVFALGEDRVIYHRHTI